MWRLSFRPELEDDIAQAVDWYNDKRSGLGDEFLTEFQAAIGRIYDNPLLFAIAENGLRPCRLRRFSYIIHIDVSGNDVLLDINCTASSRDRYDPARGKFQVSSATACGLYVYGLTCLS